MKIFQKFEIGFALASLFFAILEFIFVLSFEMRNEVIRPKIGLNSILLGLAWEVLPVFLMAVGSLSQIFRKRWIGLISVVLFGLVTILTKALLLLLNNTIHDLGLHVSLVVALSGIIAIFTILFAILGRTSLREIRGN